MSFHLLLSGSKAWKMRHNVLRLYWIVSNESGAVGGRRVGWGTEVWRKPTPLSLFPPHDLAWDQTRAAAVGNLWLTTWAMAHPLSKLNGNNRTKFKNSQTASPCKHYECYVLREGIAKCHFFRCAVTQWVGIAVMLWARIREVLGLNFNHDWSFSSFLCPSGQMPEWEPDQATTASFHVLSSLSFTSHSTIWWYVVSILMLVNNPQKCIYYSLWYVLILCIMVCIAG